MGRWEKRAIRLPTEAGNRGENGRRTSALFRLVLWKITGTIRNCLCLTAFRWQNDETEHLPPARRCVLQRATLDREPRLRSRIFVSSRRLLEFFLPFLVSVVLFSFFLGRMLESREATIRNAGITRTFARRCVSVEILHELLFR